MSVPRSIAKAAAEAVLGHTAMVRSVIRRRRGSALVLAWHNIVPVGEPPAGELALHTDRQAFERQLDELVRFTRVVPLRTLLAGDPSHDEPVSAITFDDAYSGAVAEGVAALAARGLPATIFVAPAFVGGRTFWWDRLAQGRGGQLPVPVRQECLDIQRGDDVLIAPDGVGDLPGHARAASLDALRAAATTPGIDVASHTWSHRNLARLDSAERDEELRRSASWLDERFPGWPRILSLPYGLGEDVAQQAWQAGYHAVLRIEGGWYAPRGRTDPRVLPRFNVSRGLSPRGFRLRLAGFLT